MVDNTGLFSGKADDYSKFRPSYPDAAIKFLAERSRAENVLDVGAGTGIFTAKLRGTFKNVTALEPNAGMRKEFLKFLPEIVCLEGTGEDTGLPDNSVELITVAQAFHWLDAEKFKAEAMRILRPAGQVAIVWNNSIENEFTIERNRICRKHCPRFRSGHAGKRSAAEGDAFLRHEYFTQVEVVAFDNPFVMDMEIFEGNMRSRSYALTPNDSGYGDFIAELRTAFDRFAQNGIVIEPQETRIYFGRF
ncbi:MAG: methyltransferase domain-containing protein [Lentisphaeria bacterium]|nr:methyltransferase domain-containing protein [Lentisphaeria bacterium]